LIFMGAVSTSWSGEERGAAASFRPGRPDCHSAA
jgi:hypothetical protein